MPSGWFVCKFACGYVRAVPGCHLVGLCESLLVVMLELFQDAIWLVCV